jgi:hypothetical protein
LEKSREKLSEELNAGGQLPVPRTGRAAKPMVWKQHEGNR